MSSEAPGCRESDASGCPAAARRDAAEINREAGDPVPQGRVDQCAVTQNHDRSVAATRVLGNCAGRKLRCHQLDHPHAGIGPGNVYQPSDHVRKDPKGNVGWSLGMVEPPQRDRSQTRPRRLGSQLELGGA